jgi:hypothetical protein
LTYWTNPSRGASNQNPPPFPFIENAAKAAEWETTMRGRILIAILIAGCAAQAKDKPSYQKGVLVQMESSSCGYDQKGGKTFKGEILGTDGENKKTHEVLCQEYVLQTDRIIYRIRAKDEKHPVLLPIGETAEFRIRKDTLILRVPEADDKEREYFVVSMTPRADSAENKAPRKGGD